MKEQETGGGRRREELEGEKEDNKDNEKKIARLRQRAFGHQGRTRSPVPAWRRGRADKIKREEKQGPISRHARRRQTAAKTRLTLFAGRGGL